MKKVILAVGLIASLSSCYINRHSINNGPEGKTGVTRYSHAKQVYLFWGSVKVGRPAPPVPTNCGYQVVTAFKFEDLLVNFLTGGLVGMRNVRINVAKDSNCK